jgi:DnaJ domain.
MSTEIVHQMSAEEWEYKNGNTELNYLEVKLAQKELELATFRGEMNSFRARYLAAVGCRYWELDKIEAEIAEREANQRPYDQSAQQRAKQARAQAEESAKSAGNQKQPRETASKFKPTESLKKLYRQIAKRVHPDLAVDDQERIRYQRLMAKANHAYQVGDELGLQNILRQLKKNSNIEKNNDIDQKISDKLARINRQITQVKERLAIIEKELAELHGSTLYQLKLQVEASEVEGTDLLAEMAILLDQQIAIAKMNLARIKAKGNEAFVS